MKTKEMDKIVKHFDKYFEQTDSMVLHPIIDTGDAGCYNTGKRGAAHILSTPKKEILP